MNPGPDIKSGFSTKTGDHTKLDGPLDSEQRCGFGTDLRSRFQVRAHTVCLCRLVSWQIYTMVPFLNTRYDKVLILGASTLLLKDGQSRRNDFTGIC